MTCYCKRIWQHTYHIAEQYEYKKTKNKWKIKGFAFLPAVSLIILEIKL